MQHNTKVPNTFKLDTVGGNALEGGFQPQVDYASLTCLMWLKVAIFVINEQ
jgi:hypothetical protein